MVIARKEEAIAKFNLGEMSISQLPNIALEQLAKGIESESLINLTGKNENTSYHHNHNRLLRVQ